MKIVTDFKIFKDKRIILPRLEVAYAKANKVLTFKIGFWKWDASLNLNF